MEYCSEGDAIGYEGWGDEDDDALDEDEEEGFSGIDWGVREDTRRLLITGRTDQVNPINVGKTIDARNKYSLAKSAKVGDTVCCAGCGKKFIKTTYNKTFCSNGRTTKGKSSCKDRYHNMMTPSRLDRLNLN